MKRIVTLLFIFIASLSSLFSQTNHPFELGFNGGASWEQSDVKMKKLGGGWGLTFGQMYLENKTNPIDWGWRLRYLSANAYGQGTSRSTGLAYNSALNGNGGIDTAADYYHNGGFVFQNYKTHLDEVSLEVLIGLNKMRERTRVYPYIFGGLGFTKAVAKTDQLNAGNQRYNYLSIDSTGSASAGDITSRLNSMYDGTYETTADGSNNASYKFMPSIGLGLGFQITKGFSMGIEHKMTWALNDVIDGQQWANDNTTTGNNDKYHYSSIWLKFSFGRKERTTSTTSTNTDVNSYTNTNTTTTTTNTNTTNTNTTNNNTVTTVGEKPKITYTVPATSGNTSTTNSITVTATVTNINSYSDLHFTANGTPLSSFVFNGGTHVFTCPVTLVPGANTFVLTATNNGGSVSETTSINYSQPVVVPAPIVTINNPAANPTTVHSVATTVSGTALNISEKGQMQVTQNGALINTFIFNPSSKAFDISASLVEGANTFVVKATNAGGSDTKSTTIVYQNTNVYSTPGPVVTITLPATSSSSIGTNSAPVTAQILNVNSLSQIVVTVNGTILSSGALAFNASSHVLNFNAALIPGVNVVSVSANNGSGSDSKTISINYDQPVVNTNPAPVVTFVTPSSPTSNSSTPTTAVVATVMNVTAIGQIEVTVNGGRIPTAALNFNAASHVLNFSANLINGGNAVVVSATNIGGSDSKTITIMYSAPAVPAPVVTITVPNVNPYTSSVGTTAVAATVTNVTSSSQISVNLNGTNVPFSFNAASHLVSLSPSLINGANTLTVTATNSSGSDSKSTSIIYSAPVVVQAPLVTITNPAVSPANVTTPAYTFQATVLNVTAASQIVVTLNGTNQAVSFNAATHQLTFPATLIAGANNLVVTATNAGGTDSKTATVIYTAPVVVPAPIVTITAPAASPANVAAAAYLVKATVLNVTAAGQVSVQLNGANHPFTFNLLAHSISLTANLVEGANTVVITATNAGGSDSKTTTLIYTAPVVPAPVVNITSPATTPYTSATAVYNVSATVLNVSGMSDISVSVNGTASAFTYNTGSHVVTFPVTLVAGSNTVVVSAHTAAGSDSKTKVVVYTPPAPVLPPVVTITSPNVNPLIQDQMSYTVKATVLNVSGASQIKLYQNNNPTSAFSYVVATKQLSLNATLIAGANWFKIVATNTAGKDSASVTIKVVQSNGTQTTDSVSNKPGKPLRGGGSGGALGGVIGTHVGGGTTTTTTPAGPAITFVTPAGGAAVTTTDPQYVVVATVDVMNQMNISVKVNGATITSFGFERASKTLTIPVVLNMGVNTVVIEADAGSGAHQETITITRH